MKQSSLLYPRIARPLLVTLLSLMVLATGCDDDTAPAAGDNPSDTGADTVGLDLVTDFQVGTSDSGSDLLVVDTGNTDSATSDSGASDTGTTDTDVPAPTACVMTFYESEVEVRHCEIPARTTLGCDELARCVCEAAVALSIGSNPQDVPSCIVWMTFPRGAITLSDYCALTGSTAEVDDLRTLYPTLTGVDGLGWIREGVDYRAELSESCAAVGAYTLWGESAEWLMSLGLPGEVFPQAEWSVENYPLEVPPLLTLDDVASFEASTGTIALTAAGQAALSARADDLAVANEFLFHTPVQTLMQGLFMSMVVSSTREGPVLVIEDMALANYATLVVGDGYPPDGPADFTGIHISMFAAEGKWLDAACISSCGCPVGRACREGVCTEMAAGCEGDGDCCLGTCSSGVCSQ